MHGPPEGKRNLPVGRHREVCKRDRLAGAIEREDKGSLHALQARRDLRRPWRTAADRLDDVLRGVIR
jgi:hypothetical protein